MKIALATDHAGFEQLKQLQEYLEELGHDCHDFGPKSLRPDDDYPDFIRPAAKAVAAGECEMGIILGGSGQGEAMAANRFKGVRCAVFYGPAVTHKVVDAEGHTSNNPYEILKLSREHNNANMLSLAARFVALEDMKEAIRLWIETPFSGDERHLRRNEKLDGNS
jgi:ribose 5-phosphate isomerase B